MTNQPSNKPIYRPERFLAEHPYATLARLKSDDVKANLKEMCNLPYPADPILEPDYVGLTYLQVMLLRTVERAANGSLDAFDRVLDRMVGKPQQVNTNVNVGATYKDFLDEIARKENIIDIPSSDGARSDSPEIE